MKIYPEPPVAIHIEPQVKTVTIDNGCEQVFISLILSLVITGFLISLILLLTNNDENINGSSSNFIS